MSDKTINVRELIDQVEKEGLLVERAQFLREAAIRIQAANVNASASSCWYRAMLLWDAKPEDC